MELRTIVTNGSVDNLQQVAGMKADMGFTTSDTALSAYEGTGFDSGSLKFTALARTYDNYVHVVVPTASNVVQLKHLDGLTVNVGPMNSGTKVVADLILSTAKLRKVRTTNFALEDAVAQLKKRADNQGKGPGIDALIWSGGLPTTPIGELQKSVGFRLVDIGMVAEEISLKKFGGYIVSSIPPSVYGLATSVPTLAVPNYLIARPNLSDSQGLVDGQHDVPPAERPDGGARRGRPTRPAVRDRDHADPVAPGRRALVPRQPHLSLRRYDVPAASRGPSGVVVVDQGDADLDHQAAADRRPGDHAPPTRAASERTIASPRPVPGISRWCALRQNRSPTFFRSRDPRPRPWSRTDITTSVPSRVTDTSTGGAPYLEALSSRTSRMSSTSSSGATPPGTISPMMSSMSSAAYTAFQPTSRSFTAWARSSGSSLLSASARGGPSWPAGTAAGRSGRAGRCR